MRSDLRSSRSRCPGGRKFISVDTLQNYGFARLCWEANIPLLPQELNTTCRNRRVGAVDSVLPALIIPMQPLLWYSRFKLLPIRHYKFHKTPLSSWVLFLLLKLPCVRTELNPWRALTSSNLHGLSLAARPGYLCIETKEHPLSTFQHPSLWANP